MFRRIAPAAIILSVMTFTPVSRAGDWDHFAEFDAAIEWARATDSLLDPGSGENVWDGTRSLAGGILFRRDLYDALALDIDLSAAGTRTRESGEQAGPGGSVVRLSVDFDLPIGIENRVIKRVAVGAQYEKSSVDFGESDLGERSRFTLATMLVERPNEPGRRCPRGTTSLWYGRESFEDELNGGDPEYDRSDDGGYWSARIEQSWLFGKVPDCIRTGPFRRYLHDDRTQIVAGWSRRREATLGSLFDVRSDAFYFEGQAPLWRGGRLGLLWDASYTHFDYTEGERDDAAVAGQVAVRWLLNRRDIGPVRRVEARLGITHEHRNSKIDDFDFDRWTLFAGLSVRIDDWPKPETVPEGSSTIDRRRPSGGSTPKTPREATPR